ncbi:MAG: ComEA family DNA-binding protein [Dehalococcoidia bacterium]|nr:ComEA family DNA-binding protein [Dehalococcoidia bacterium]
MNVWLDRNRGLLIIAFAALLALALVLLLSRYRHDPPPLELRLDQIVDGEIVVHVAGAVRHPGIYSLAADARVADALEAAGGPAEDADLLTLNLAKRLHDEEQLIVPAIGATDGLPATNADAGKIDINSADARLLDTLPGIGEVYSQRIVDSREANGPFQTVDDLITRELIPRSTYDKIKDLVTVGP